MKNENFGAEEIYLAPETNQLEETPEITNADAVVKVEEKTKQATAQVREIRELREGNRKVFQMSDGSHQAVFYPETIHVFDENTKNFEDVEHTFTEEEDGRYFIGGKRRFKAKFSQEEDNDTLFTVEKGMHRITVSAKKNGKQRNKGVKPMLRKKMRDGIEQNDQIVFANVQPGADYEYSLTGDGVKENIVVKEKADVYRYAFRIQQEHVTAAFDETNRRIGFLSTETGEEVFFIPAPFMTDANGSVSTAVSYEVKNTAGGDLLLNIVADSRWMNEEDRVFPVIIDPQIAVSGSPTITTYSWMNDSFFSGFLHTVGKTSTDDCNCNAHRMYMRLAMPALPRNPRIKKAEIEIAPFSTVVADDNPPLLGLYRVATDLDTCACTPVHENALIDYAKMKMGMDGSLRYTFDITTLVDQVYKGEMATLNLVLKMVDETDTRNNSVTFYGSTYGGEHIPTLKVTYESGYGVNTSYRTHTHELGRFGQGSVDLQCGNLMFESEDFAWEGNCMPVTIKHLYNSALSAYPYTANDFIGLSTADFSAMKIGNGFKLNIMQSMVYKGGRYVYTGEDGQEIYFKESEEQVWCDSNTNCYYLYEEENDGDMRYDPEQRTLKQGDDIYQFDTVGRLVKITDTARPQKNTLEITYAAGRITSVTDGTGRNFWFAYSDGFLTSITAPDETQILYTYTGDLLNTITYPEGKKVSITYQANKPANVALLDNNQVVYQVAYTFSGDRLTGVTEFGADDVVGVQSTYDYSVASGRTMVTTTEPKDENEGETADNVIKTVYTFDDEGNIVSEYVHTRDTSNTGVNGEANGVHPYSGDGGVGIVSGSHNFLCNHGFKTTDSWSAMPCNDSTFSYRCYGDNVNSKFGRWHLRMQSGSENCVCNGIYQTTSVLPSGTYTYSVYLRVDTAFCGGEESGAFIRVVDTTGRILGVSEYLTDAEKDYTRVMVPFTVQEPQRVQAEILVSGKGLVYVDGAQMERNPYATSYNMLENGNFEQSSGWTYSDEVHYSIGTGFNMGGAIMMTGALPCARYAVQEVGVKRQKSIRETFTLSGWAKGYGLPNCVRDGVDTPTFRLRAQIQYSGGTTEEYMADFSPCTEEWQFASVQFAKSQYKSILSVLVYCDYDYNVGTVYFDDIQLVRDHIEEGLLASDFTVESTDTEDDEETLDKVDREDTAPTFEEAKDEYGNTLTETTFSDGEFGTIYRAFQFTTDCNCPENAGNDLVSETDARGGSTFYDVDGETSRNQGVTDRCGNKTAYEYDDAGRTTKVISKSPQYDEDGNKKLDENGNVLYRDIAHVSYTYDAFDNMTEIHRGDGLNYVLTYNQFHNLEAIGIKDKTENLIHYTYKNGNGRLKQMTYANGHTMKASYNSLGQMVSERWYDAVGILVAEYKYVYDDKGNIVRSIDILRKKEYNYAYDAGKIVRATECEIELQEDIITSRKVIHSIRYTYDREDKLVKKVIAPLGGTVQTVYYEHSEDDNTISRFTAGDRTVTSHSKTDSFGRKVFDELQLGTGFVSREFRYLQGDVPEEHKTHEKLKSSPTTQLVSEILFADGRKISYAYDAEERITEVVDSLEGTTKYTYDALGQLETETAGDVTTKFEYDNYGNITAKGIVDESGAIAEATRISYGYGDDTWKDLLTSYNGQSITYDAQGNPIQYLGHTLTWEKGRQLKSFDSNTYTYNANGIRTGKTVDGILHTYTLDGTKILQETWCENTLVPLYDNEDSVCGIVYNDVPYFFYKNLQGNVIAITDQDANVVATYTYDAWGVCTSSYTNDELPNGVDIAAINPYRYRGYYYDEEIGLYYVSSRYYDPEIGRFLNSDDPMFLGATGNIASYNLFAYCENNPVNYKDPSGYGPAGTIIGAILGFGLGALLVPRVADLLKLRGWGRKVFIVLGVAALTGLGAYVGNYIGEAIFAIYKAGGAFALKINKAIANGIAKIVGGSIKAASGNGWIIKIGKFTLRIMTSGGGRTNYFRLSHATKGALTILGKYSGDRGLTHIPITFSNIIKIINLILKLFKK